MFSLTGEKTTRGDFLGDDVPVTLFVGILGKVSGSLPLADKLLREFENQRDRRGALDKAKKKGRKNKKT